MAIDKLEAATWQMEWAVKRGVDRFDNVERLLKSALEDVARMKAGYLSASLEPLAVDKYGQGVEYRLGEMSHLLVSNLLGNCRIDLCHGSATEIAVARAELKAVIALQK